MLRNTQGIHMPLRLQMERNVAVKVGRSRKSTYKKWNVLEIFVSCVYHFFSLLRVLNIVKQLHLQ